MGNSIEHCQTCETRVMCHMERRCMALPPVAGSSAMEKCFAKWETGPSKGSYHGRHRWIDGRCKWCYEYKSDLIRKMRRKNH